jgi:membrane fusion protein (multidrug efflux system)
VIKRHFFLISAAVLLAVMVVAGAFRVIAGGEKEERAGPGGGRGGQQVAAVTVQSRPFSDAIEVLGVAKGRQSVTLTAANTELITRVMFRDGQRVARGTPLVELQAAEEDAAIIEARAELDQARLAFDRWRELSERGYAPRAQLEQFEANYRTAQARLQAAQARRGDRVIRAPFSGVVGLSDVAPGALVNPGAPIATLDDLSVVRVDFDVPERFLGSVREGGRIVATADALDGSSFSGRIAKLDTRIDENTRAITARAEFANPGGLIRPGMLMRVRIVDDGRSATAVPESAIQFEGETASVFRIVSQGERTVAQRVTVATGAREGGYVEILDGLRPGERLVASGLNRVQPNQPVRIAGAAGAAAASGTAP